MNFEQLTKVLEGFETDSARELLSIVKSLIVDQSLLLPSDKFGIVEDLDSRLLCVKIDFNELLSRRGLVCLSCLPKYFTLDSVGNRFRLKIFVYS